MADVDVRRATPSPISPVHVRPRYASLRGPELHAPRPRRHLPLWLYDQDPSPASSRAASPTSIRFIAPPSAPHAPSTAARRLAKHHPLLLTIAATTLIKLLVGLGPYSGQGTPPMYGDFEAQRHWMEITLHLPPREWYWYELEWWGLDYPPLTAYVSWLCGFVGNSRWFALDTSRGMESEGLKLFMRLTVVVLDAVVWVPAVVWWARCRPGSASSRARSASIIAALANPCLLLVDFGHFQYNSVMLGLTLLAACAFVNKRYLVGAVLFSLSLSFKQMALYYAPAIGIFLLATCIQAPLLFPKLAAVTTVTFLLVFAPFLSTLPQAIHRIFPFARGLFEDKVANFWCFTNVLIKWRLLLSVQTLVRLSTVLTVLGFLPAVILMAQAPEPRLLPYALLTSSLAFFLFSFQVHEKTILVPLLPALMLTTKSEWITLFSNTAAFSMWPLLKRDGLGLQYIATLLLWNRLVGSNPFARFDKWDVVKLLSVGVYAAAFILHLAELLIPAPARYPDLWAVANVLVCTPVFFAVWAWSVKAGMEERWAGAPILTTKVHSRANSLSPAAPRPKSRLSRESLVS
ncbi:related to Probable dolichyl pyrophosphate Man9GlcNAc2 alpha-1,3-glucosyltransferase [Armillaria ostoyae]|uniref:Alpha-1,3-glucosyltransferase n=1 Tax=Armillaria ostoyae TaxID=47428 RepID=A0A284R4T1_ARMOS|nr:related to Probable dolichyl pyrophosphate Man9GlcNAc2 alpha-1,3-glucosyltransferase [Armillaria ostoyae]